MSLRSGRTLMCMAVLVAAAATPCLAQELSTRSPFVPEGAAAGPAPTENAPLELRGIVEFADGFQFGLFDPSSRQSVWVRLNEPAANFVVRSHDIANETVTVDYQGRTLTLGMKAAKVQSLGPVPNPTVSQAARGPNAPVVLNPSAADEARRLEGVAAEVRRRRMMRQAAAQNAAGQPRPQPAPGPVLQGPANPAPSPGAPPSPQPR